MAVHVLDVPLASNMAPSPSTRTDAENRVARAHIALLAETSRCLSDSLDYQTSLATTATLALPHFGVWCMVDIVEPDGSIRRAVVIHPDADKQRRAADYYAKCPPSHGDAIGVARVLGAHRFAAVAGEHIMEAVGDAADRDLLREFGAQSYLIVPICTRGRTLGAITFVSDDVRRYDDADLLLAEDLGRRCGMAVDNARLYRVARDARRAAETAHEGATFAVGRANALREVADQARQEAEGANRAKAAFLTTLSHEFRTPLGAILGFVGLLNDGLAGPLAPLQRDYLRRIGNASGSLLRLIEEVLTLSQVNAGHGRVRVEEADLSAIVREVAQLLQPLVGAKQLSLTVDLPEAPIFFPTDVGKFRQIVINLAANAVKFTSAGEVRLSLSKDENGIVLRVRDTGEGISADEAELLFEAFSQAGPSDAHHARGTGLGLSITRQLAQLMGGDVSVESELGSGSQFTVRLPSGSASAEQTPEPRSARLRDRRASERAEGGGS